MYGDTDDEDLPPAPPAPPPKAAPAALRRLVAHRLAAKSAPSAPADLSLQERIANLISQAEADAQAALRAAPKRTAVAKRMPEPFRSRILGLSGSQADDSDAAAGAEPRPQVRLTARQRRSRSRSRSRRAGSPVVGSAFVKRFARAMEAPPRPDLSSSKVKETSKKLSRLLRHDQSMGLDAEGFVPVSRLEQRWGHKDPDLPDLLSAAIQNNDKSRFAAVVRDGHPLIRALQGHSVSIDPEAAMTRLSEERDFPSWVVHRTVAQNLPSIRKYGLSPGCRLAGGGRNDVHFATRRHLARRSGVPLYFDLRSWVRDGREAFLSGNGVVCVRDVIPWGRYLTDQQPPDFDEAEYSRRG